MAHISNTNTLSGPAMSVLLGFISLIGVWLLPVGLFFKIIVSIIGVILIVIGIKNG